MRRKVKIPPDGSVPAADQQPAVVQNEAAAPGAPAPRGADRTQGEPSPPTDVAETDAAIAALEDQIADLEARLEESRNQSLRTLADFQNFRRRNEQQIRERAQFANQEIVTGLLPILDNLERALQAADASKSYEALVGGVALTLRQLQDYLARNGVEPIEAVGKQFDPNFHEAVQRVEDGDHPENTIVEELQRGYTMHSRVLRPSMVRVAHRG